LPFFAHNFKTIFYQIDLYAFFSLSMDRQFHALKKRSATFQLRKPETDLMQPIVIMTPAIPNPLDLRWRGGNIAAIRCPARVRGRSDISARNKFQP
jgi:hypothetical protein